MYRFLVNLFFIALHMNSNSVGATPVDGEALFNSDDLFLFDMPLSCEGKENFCFDKDERYPEKHIEELLKQLPMLTFNERIDSGLTFGDGNENPDCPTNKDFVDKPIYYIRDEHNKVRAVVQSPGKFQQLYSAKWCEYPGQITHNTSNFLNSQRLEKFKIECVNMFMNFDFLVLTDEGKTEIARLKGGIPVCCKCKYSLPG